MALITCNECGNEVSTSAKFCPQCGGAVNTQTILPGASSTTTDHRKVSIPLIIGIVLLPYIFAWLLLGKGYSTQSRVIGLGWMAFLLVMVGIGRSNPNGEGNATSSTRTTIVVDPNRADKDRAAALAKQVVPSALKDPSSAEFGDVWGMSATVACGFVNAKNSFGAMAGRSRFILDDGRVSMENGQAGFARQWNAKCVDKPQAPPPSGAGTIRWGSRPPSSLKLFAPATGEGLAVYIPKAAPEPQEGVTVAEADYSFDHGRLFSANFYIDGESGRDAILAACVKKYGTPQAYDEDAGSYSWKWPSSRISVGINYSAKHDRTTLNFNHD